MAKAVINAAQAKGLEHEEMHTKVEYVVAHGISSSVDGKKVVIGSYHFVFEDEQCVVPEGRKNCLQSCLRNIHTCIWLSRIGWQQLYAYRIL